MCLNYAHVHTHTHTHTHTAQAEDGWFSRKCRKVNHSHSMLSFLVPSFLSFSEEGKPFLVQTPTQCVTGYLSYRGGQQWRYSHDSVSLPQTLLWRWLWIIQDIFSTLGVIGTPSRYLPFLPPSLPPSLPPFLLPSLPFSLPCLSPSLPPSYPQWPFTVLLPLSPLQVYDLGEGGTSLARAAQMAMDETARSTLSTLRTADKTLVQSIVQLAVLPKSESSTLHLIAITSAGGRADICGGSVGQVSHHSPSFLPLTSPLLPLLPLRSQASDSTSRQPQMEWKLAHLCWPSSTFVFLLDSPLPLQHSDQAPLYTKHCTTKVVCSATVSSSALPICISLSLSLRHSGVGCLSNRGEGSSLDGGL